MKFAAIQMIAEFAQVKKNLEITERLASNAFKSGAECVILPEFFTSAMGFHPNMLNVVRDLHGEPMKLLQTLSIKYNGIIGGSFIAYRAGEIYNTFILVFPNGKVYYHDKDQPTMWENCYYIGGNDDGILETPIGNIGVAMCWELIRTRTAKRLLNHVDLIIGGSCWWTLPEKPVPGFPQKLHHETLEILIETPARLAKMLGVHIIHASHAGNFECRMPLIPKFPYKSYYQGETQIVDGKGRIIARMKREEGEGFIIADINPKKKWNPSEPIPKSFWIPDLPRQIKFIWWYQNKHGRRYYHKKVKPFINI